MTDMIVSLIGWIENLFLRIFPEVDIMSKITWDFKSGISAVVDWLTKVNFIVPLPDIVTIICIIIAFRISGFVIFAVNWMIRRICDLIP